MASLSLILSVTCTIIAVCSASCSYGVYENKVTSGDINIIVKKHNELRSLISQGKVPGQPKGTNLKQIKWDPAIAQAAQNIANSCEFKHVSVRDGRWYVGQNLFSSSSTGKKAGADWNGAIQAWFNEYKKYKYPSNPTGGTGHYTQVVWADTMYVGCGYTFFNTGTGWHQKIYVCNYGPGGNIIGRAPYAVASRRRL